MEKNCHIKMKLGQRIIEKYQKEQLEWHFPRLGFYHASQIYEICEGKLLPKDFFKRKVHDNKTIFNFWMGHMYQDAINKMFPEALVEIPCEIEIAEGVKIVGKCDMNINNVLVEFKTCTNFPTKPYDSHIYQFNCYLHSLGKDSGYITYINKSAQIENAEDFTRDFLVEYDKNLIDYIKQKTLEFHQKLLLIKVENKNDQKTRHTSKHK